MEIRDDKIADVFRVLNRERARELFAELIGGGMVFVWGDELWLPIALSHLLSLNVELIDDYFAALSDKSFRDRQSVLLAFDDIIGRPDRNRAYREAFGRIGFSKFVQKINELSADKSDPLHAAASELVRRAGENYPKWSK